jgi:phenylalanyl-tRNA synthetase beta chain
MNISYRWLRSLAPSITDTPQRLAERLALLGAPVDEVTHLSEGIRGIVIARVTDVRQHPNADRLRVCSVDAGGDLLQVVCGAPNVEAGRHYPFAPVGASLPGGVEIRKAKLRGEVSEGMLCSARELGLGRDHAGLMTLAGDWQPGSSFVDSLGLEDTRMLVDVTPNRPELLSHLGIARELAPGGAAAIELKPFGSASVGVEVEHAEREGRVAGVRIRIEDAEACPRYTAAVVRGVRVEPSPEWLATRLRAIGVRPINNVVDATNYVLHELGQPLHAFDLARIGGAELRIRRAAPGETLRTLDGVERALAPEMQVIADATRPIALAGVMGGEDSEVTGATTDLLLECARFEARVTRRTARGNGLSTDASYRFERGVDPELQLVALRRLVDLLVTVAGGRVDGHALDLQPTPFVRRTVTLRPERVARVLGVAVTVEETTSLLVEIGFGVAADTDAVQVEVPGFRFDIAREIDLVEEIARRRGYDSFPETLLPFRPSVVPDDPTVALQRALRERFVARGFLEARTAGFAPSGEGRVPLLNPLSSEESHLRDTLVHGLLRRVEHNWARGARDVRLFEIGTVFAPGEPGGQPREELRIAAAFTGARRPRHWTGPVPAWDLWDLKSLAEELAGVLGGSVVSGDHAPLEPVTVAGERFVLGDGVTGGAGRVAGAALDAPAWAEPVWVLEATIPALGRARGGATYRALPEHPAIERDLALVVPSGTSAQEVRTVLESSAGPLLDDIALFDRYAGAGLPEGTSSLGWRLRFRSADRTLTDAEVEPEVERVLRALEERLGVHRR